MWEHEPLTAVELVKLCQEQLGWKRTTTYTVIKRLGERGMNQFFLKVVNSGIFASWLIPVVLILRFLLKKAPKWINVLLWGIVAVRLICPISFESRVSLVPSAETIPLNIGSFREFYTTTGHNCESLADMDFFGVRSLADRHDYYAALLAGEQTLVNSDSIQWWIPDFRSAGIMEYEYTYMDLDGDGTVELLVQMVNEPTSYNGVFHYEAGQLYCWNSDASEMSCRDYPLVDGNMVRQYDNSGNTSYTIFRYSDRGEKVDIHHFFARVELVPENSTDPYPYYEVDGEEVPKSIFEELLKEQITDKTLDREAWMRN